MIEHILLMTHSYIYIYIKYIIQNNNFVSLHRIIFYSISVTHSAGNFAWEFVCSKISVIVSGRVCNVHPRPNRCATVGLWMVFLLFFFRD